MKRCLFVTFALLAVMALGGFALAIDSAADRPATPAAADRAANQQPMQLSEREMFFRSDRLAKLDVFQRDHRDAKLGSLEDLTVNAHTGRILYGILDTGLGGKRIPVPWSALQLSKDRDNKVWLTLNKSKDELANAPSIEKKERLNFTEGKFTQTVDTFFGTKTAIEKMDHAGPGHLTTNEMIFDSSGLSGLNVFNRTETSKKLGSLDNLIVDAHRGKVLYGIVDTGVNGRNVVVPWAAFQLQKAVDDNKFWLTLSKTENELANAPVFERDRMDQFADSDFRNRVDNFFGVRTVARPEMR